jgi:hypothetical protein
MRIFSFDLMRVARYLFSTLLVPTLGLEPRRLLKAVLPSKGSALPFCYAGSKGGQRIH